MILVFGEAIPVMPHVQQLCPYDLYIHFSQDVMIIIVITIHHTTIIITHNLFI